MSQAEELRRCFLEALPSEAQAENYTPLPAQIYVPPAHRRALSPDRPVVLGGRGTGKSFWQGALLDDARRRLVADAFDMPELERAKVSIGFDPNGMRPDLFPDSRTLRFLMQQGYEPSDIWYAVILRALGGPDLFPQEDWDRRIKWTIENVEMLSRKLYELDKENQRAGFIQLVVFDGLDRTAPHSWKDTQALLRGLLMNALEFRSRRALRLKIFLRPDMLDAQTTSFPDASKLVSNEVRLDWADTDLYGLLWQYLGNARETGGVFREFAAVLTKVRWKMVKQTFPVPEALRTDGSLQRGLFHALAGKSMGGGVNRGDTWKWLPNHLADESGFVSPRSFIVALHQAAIDSATRDFAGKEPTCLHWRAVQDGVQVASKVRLNELYEDFPWIRYAIEPLNGLGVPCESTEILARWRKSKTVEKVLGGLEEKLPPAQVTQDDPGSLLLALVRLGVCRIMDDGRVNMPDIVRVDADIPRRGGVPLRKGSKP